MKNTCRKYEKRLRVLFCLFLLQFSFSFPPLRFDLMYIIFFTDDLRYEMPQELDEETENAKRI